MKNKIVIPDELEFKQTVIMMGLEEIGTDVQSRAMLTKSFFFFFFACHQHSPKRDQCKRNLATLILNRYPCVFSYFKNHILDSIY